MVGTKQRQRQRKRERERYSDIYFGGNETAISVARIERKREKLWIPPLPVPRDGAYAAWLSLSGPLSLSSDLIPVLSDLGLGFRFVFLNSISFFVCFPGNFFQRFRLIDEDLNRGIFFFLRVMNRFGLENLRLLSAIDYIWRRNSLKLEFCFVYVLWLEGFCFVFRFYVYHCSFYGIVVSGCTAAFSFAIKKLDSMPLLRVMNWFGFRI